jgi:hypothetical protein
MPPPPRDREGPAGVKVALLVGVTEYDHARLDDLKYAGRDVEEMAALLRQNGYARVVVLVSAPATSDCGRQARTSAAS